MNAQSASSRGHVVSGPRCHEDLRVHHRDWSSTAVVQPRTARLRATSWWRGRCLACSRHLVPAQAPLTIERAPRGGACPGRTQGADASVWSRGVRVQCSLSLSFGEPTRKLRRAMAMRRRGYRLTRRSVVPMLLARSQSRLDTGGGPLRQRSPRSPVSCRSARTRHCRATLRRRTGCREQQRLG